MTTNKMLTGVTTLLLAAAAGSANPLLVPSQYPTIQAAINAAQPADTIIIADGTYAGAGNINLRVQGKEITIRSANGPEATTINAGRNGSVFILDMGETRDTVIEGLTIRGGNQSGIRISSASPTIINCHIIDNWNGAIGGGGILVDNGGDLALRDSLVDDNRGSQGGGILLWQQSQASIERCTISNNYSDITGGSAVMADLGSTLFMDACTITGNIAAGFAGSSAGVRIARDSVGSIVNSLFYGNTANNSGAGISFTNTAQGRVLNCTIANNQANSGGGGLLITEGVGTVLVANTILWGNIPDQVLEQSGQLMITYSLIQGGWPGTGNSDQDPVFIVPWPPNNNFAPSAHAAIDSGNNNYLPSFITADLAGNPRFVDFPGVPPTGVPGGPGGSSIVDIGAYEMQAGCYANCDGSTTPPILNVDDFTCFINEFSSALALPHTQQITHYANCDQSTTAPVLNVDDFTCFINAFAAGCP